MKKTMAFFLLFSFLLGFNVLALASAPTKTAADFDPSEYTDEALAEIQDLILAELANRRKAERADVEPIEGNILDGWEFDSDYISNEYYDIVETACYKSRYGTTYLIHKVLAKQDVSLSSTIIATAADGSVIGKRSDEIVLTEGQFNYFHYAFEENISNATLSVKVKSEDDSFFLGEREAVEMVTYNQSGENLYITLKQVKDEIGSFAKFKLLYYKEDKIVGFEGDGYIDVYAENLEGEGTTDVASIWVYGENFDRIEFIFEP